MHLKYYLAAVAIAATAWLARSQDREKLIALTVSSELSKNSNSVIRQNDITITIESVDLATVVQDRIITVFNKLGMRDVAAIQAYSKTTKIKDLEAVVYDQLGNEITTIKERDFRDASAVDGGTLYADDRVKYLEYTPRSFPITIHYKAEVDYKSTAFLPQWWPLEGFYCSTQSSRFKVINETDIEVKYKEQFLENYDIQKNGELDYTATNLAAQAPEDFSPDFKTYAPGVKLAMTRFEMEGIEGSNESWSDFGKWMNDRLLADTGELPEEVKTEIKELTKNAATSLEKAQLIYKYVQDRSRYISVQVGIGGWKPIEAAEVHATAYGDCKGLTNYTMSLLKEIGVTSHYAAIYGGEEKIDMDSDFSMTEGNHVILYLPSLEADQDYWLECTSKNAPFGYMSNFTDDRDALVITPDGGRLIHTTSYPTLQNVQETQGDFKINKEGAISGNLSMKSSGVQYAWRSDLTQLSALDLKNSYMDFWDHLNGLQVEDVSLEEDKSEPTIVEKVMIDVPNYGSISGNLLLFQPVLLNRLNKEATDYSNRELDIEISRGFIDTDKYTIKLEDRILVDGLPNEVNESNEFGEYRLNFMYNKENNTIEVTRYLKMNEGVFDKSKYEKFKEFRSLIVKNDNARGVLKINS